MKFTISRHITCFSLAVALTGSTGFSQQKPKTTSADKPSRPAILTVSEIKPGMRGVAYTVFEGVKPEAMEVEILGVLKNMNGPKSDLILARLKGTKPEYTGVVAGMSGSPVYIDGKLIGALSYRIGQFSKEPIAGITPIADMLEINEMDSAPTQQSIFTPTRPQMDNSAAQPGPQVSKTSSAGDAAASGWEAIARYMTPIAAPLVFSGFSEETLKRFGSAFQAAGVMPVMGAGSSSDDKQPEPIEPGSAVSAMLVRGDMNIAATCTVTYADADRLLACGHPLMQFGRVEMPMTKARVIATLPSPLNAFKIVNTTETIGSFMQDRHTGIMGRFDKSATMIPVMLTVHGAAGRRQYHYEVLNNARLTPVAMMATVYNVLNGMNDYGEELSFRLNGHIKVNGYADVDMQNMFAPSEKQPTALGVALNVGERFGRIFDNSYETPEIQGVDLDLDLVPERRSATLEAARTDVTEARPGDEVVIEAVLKPYRGDRIIRRIPVRVPSSTPKGTLRILVSDGDTLDRARHMNPAYAHKLDLHATIAALNQERVNSRLYTSLLEPNPQAMVEDKVLPTLPLSVMNVMDGMRGTQDMVVIGESAVNESSTPLDFVVTGAQIISISVK